MKRIFGLSLVLFILISTSVVSVTSQNTPIQDFIKIDESLVVNETQNFFATTGPLKFTIVKIRLLDGHPDQIQKIRRIIYGKGLHFIRPFTIVPVTDMTFSVTYRRNIMFNRPGFSYATGYYENGNSSNATIISNIKHTVIVNEFDGVFVFSRAHLFRLRATLRTARFVFSGICNSTTIST